MKKIIFGLVTLLATITFAQNQSEALKTSVPLTNEELSEIKQELMSSIESNSVHKCVYEILKTKRAGEILNVKEDWREYLAIEGSAQDWKNLNTQCNLQDSYYDIVVNANGQTGITQFRMRSVSYLYSTKLSTKLYFYSPVMTQQGINSFIAELRRQSSSKAVNMGELQGLQSLHKVTVKNKYGKEMVLASLEQRLAERAQECQQLAQPGKEEYCESLGYAIQLRWVYNNAISYQIMESMEDSKFDASVERIVMVGDSQIESINDIRDIFPESSLLASLKQDWIIRNSNQWTRFAKAQSWDQFWNLKAKEIYGSVAEFQSYSNKLGKDQVSKVMACAKLAGSDIETNSGFACVNSKKAPTMYMFNYRVTNAALTTSFSVTKMDSAAVYVRIPLMSDSTGTATLSLALPRKSSDVFFNLQ